MASLALTLDGKTDFQDETTASPEKSSSILSSLRAKINSKGTTDHAAGSLEYTDQRAFKILQDFLQPNTTLSLEATVVAILSLLPVDGQNSQQVNSFGQLCCELAEKIPYHHPSQLKLVRLLGEMGNSPKVVGRIISQEVSKDNFYRYQQLKDHISDVSNGPYPGQYVEWVNFNAFLANLEDHKIWGTNPDYAITALRESFEKAHTDGQRRPITIMAAAQWILWNGQGLFKQILYSGDFAFGNEYDVHMWRGGPLFDGKPTPSHDRWRFWKIGFRDASLEDGLSEECRRLAKRSADVMETLESGLSF